MKTYGMTELFQLMGFDSCREDALTGFLIRPGGVWLAPLTERDLENLHPNELAAVLGPFTAHDPTKPVLAFPCSGKELKHFLVETGLYCGEEIDTERRHVITSSERKAKDKSAIQVAVEAFLDECPSGGRKGFYSFLKERIKLPKECDLKDGQSYAFFFSKVIETGSSEGVYLNNAKEGKREGDPGWNHYSGVAISGLLAKEKNRRKNT